MVLDFKASRFWELYFWMVLRYLKKCQVQFGTFIGLMSLIWGTDGSSSQEGLCTAHIVHQLHSFLDQKVLLTATHAISQIDYCNMLQYCIVCIKLPLKNIKKLQLLQNTVPQLAMYAPWFVHITPLLCDLYRLPVCCQMQFKVLIVTVSIKPFMTSGQVIWRITYPWLCLPISSDPAGKAWYSFHLLKRAMMKGLGNSLIS